MDRLYILTGFLWLIAGMVFGVYLGITDQLQFANSHAHANLLGFVISVLFGLIHRNWPVLMASKLALPQFALFEIGSLVLVAGKYDIDGGGGGVLAPPGSVLVVMGTLVMFWMFARATADIKLTSKGAV
ncbi:MAG: hypothetical protein HKN30_08730 [Sulfitobacter sp.]|nr:hypothetical protein [Sulfitobacter sp.]